MAAAAAALGVQHHWLGFVDSGLPEGDPLPPLPEGCFALVPLEEAAAPLVELVRSFKPHVITTYDENGGYPHPDHIMCHKVSVEAFEAAGDPERYVGRGEPWTPSKLYYNGGFSLVRMRAVHEALLEAGRESPFGEWIDSREAREIARARGHHADRRRAPTSSSATRRCGRTPRRSTRTASSSRCRARSSWRSGRPRSTSSRSPGCPTNLPEDDLFAGLRDGAS